MEKFIEIAQTILTILFSIIALFIAISIVWLGWVLSSILLPLFKMG